VSVDREEICERIVTGTREVTVEVPDPEQLAAVPTVSVTKTVEDVEWICRPLLDDATTAPAVAA
jgi:heme-binding NEAT domain protein